MERASDAQSRVFAVRTDSGALRRSAKGSITGALFLEIEGRAFPEPDWNDFPVVVLAWWIRAALVLQRTNAPASCLFMDGPFEWRVSLAGPGAWAVTLLDRHDAVRVVLSACVDADVILGALAAAADSLLRACNEQSWSSVDIEELRSAREALRH